MNTARIPIRNVKRKVVAYAIVSSEDGARARERKWHFTGGYPMTFMEWDGKMRRVNMGRFIIGCSMEPEPDHINRDKKDNRRENLRAVTRAENLKNRDLSNNGRPPGTWIQDAIFKLPIAPSLKFKKCDAMAVQQAVKYLKKTGRINKNILTRIAGNEVRVIAF